MWTLLQKALATQLHYLGNYLSYLGIQAAAQLLTLFYLYTVFTYTDSLNGWTKQQAVFVFYLASMVILAAECFTCSIQQYYQKLVRGQLDPLLILPLHGRALQLLRWSEPGFLVPVLILLCCWPWIDPQTSRPLLDWVAGGVALLFGVFAIIVVFALASLPALLTQRQAPADFMVSELSRMIFLPSGVMPRGSWQFALGITLPLLLSANAAGAIFINGQYQSAYILICGTLFLSLLHHLLEVRLKRSFSYPGS